MKKLKVTKVPGGFEFGKEIITSDQHLIELMQKRKRDVVKVFTKYDNLLFRIEFNPKPVLVNMTPNPKHFNQKSNILTF